MTKWKSCLLQVKCGRALGFLFFFRLEITDALISAFMTELYNPHRLCCRCCSWPRFAQTAADPSRLKRIIKPSLCSQMTEEHENPPWRADMYFVSTELPQLEGLADVFLVTTGLTYFGSWPSLSLGVSSERVSWHFCVVGNWILNSRTPLFKCLFCLQVVHKFSYTVKFPRLGGVRCADRWISKVWKPFVRSVNLTPVDLSVVWNIPLTATVKSPNIFHCIHQFVTRKLCLIFGIIENYLEHFIPFLQMNSVSHFAKHNIQRNGDPP